MIALYRIVLVIVAFILIIICGIILAIKFMVEIIYQAVDAIAKFSQENLSKIIMELKKL